MLPPGAHLGGLERAAPRLDYSTTRLLHDYNTTQVHNAEEWNELHHLLIMESLGGNALWSDRFLAYHVAFAYYW